MKLLIVTEYITPNHTIASIRWTKLGKYLKKKHAFDQIDVLTTDKCSFLERKADSTLGTDRQYLDRMYLAECPFWVKWRRILWTQFRKWKKPPEKRHKSIDTLRSNLLFQEDQRICSRFESVISRMDFTQYDVVISSYGPIWPVIIGSRIREMNPSLLWVVDFRDQWLRDFDPKTERERKLHWARTSTRQADLFFRVNDQLDLIETWGKPVLTIPNGFDSEDRQEIQTAGRFIIAYTGTLYRTDDLLPFFQVLKDLGQSGELDFQDVSLVYAGNNSGSFEEEVRQAGLEEIYTDLGLVDRKESLQLQARSSILLMAGWTSESDVVEWSGKMYEYMMAARPVVYMMNTTIPWTLPARDMHRLGGVCYENCRHEETLPELREYVRKMYRMWKETGQVRIEQDQSYINQYRYDVIAGQVYDVLRRELDRRKS